MTGIRLIASGAYVEQELSAEFGQIPPAFLPIGVSRLYEAQVSFFGSGVPVYLTVPESFTPQHSDRRRLLELGVTLVPVPEDLSLGESIVYAINYIAAAPGSVELLHGDTLIDAMPVGCDDLIAVHDEGDDYSWAAANLADQSLLGLEVIAAGTERSAERPVACGYFVFSSSTLLVRAITRARGDFIAGLNLYLRDRALRAVRVTRWLDFGHIQTYFRSRRAMTTARSFNKLKFDSCTVHKSSDDRLKMQAEANWYSKLPAAVQPYCARIIEQGEADGFCFYRTEYLYAPTLAELFVFSSIGRPTWRKILRSCRDFLEVCVLCRGPGSGDLALAELAVDKTGARLERFAQETGFDIEKSTRLGGQPMPSLARIAEQMAEMVDLGSGRTETLMHGDFCFSNILYNSRAGRITVIDPRGYVRPTTPSTFGDIRYDLAKLSHSISGYYDYILAGRYVLTQEGSHEFSLEFETGTHHDWLQREWAEMEVDGVGADSIGVRAIVVGLFLSMLPLHADRPDRQATFIANALRLYAQLEEGRS